MLLFLFTFLLTFAVSGGMRARPSYGETFLQEILDQRQISHLTLLASQNFDPTPEYVKIRSELRSTFKQAINEYIERNIDSMRVLHNEQRKLQLIKEIDELTSEYSSLIDRYFGDGLPLWQREVLKDQMEKTRDHILSLYQLLWNHYNTTHRSLIKQIQPKRTEGVAIQGVYITDLDFIKLHRKVEQLRGKNLPVEQGVLDKLQNMVTELVDREKSSLDNLRFDYVFQWNRIVEERSKSQRSDVDEFRNDFIFRFKQLERTEQSVLSSVKKNKLMSEIDELLTMAKDHKKSIIKMHKEVSTEESSKVIQSTKHVFSFFDKICDSRIKNPVFELKLHKAVNEISYSLKKKTESPSLKRQHMTKWNQYFYDEINGRFEESRQAKKLSLDFLEKMLSEKRLPKTTEPSRQETEPIPSPSSITRVGKATREANSKHSTVNTSNRCANPNLNTDADTQSFTAMLSKLYDNTIELFSLAIESCLDLIPDSEYANEIIIATFSTVRKVGRATAKTFDESVEIVAKGFHSATEYAVKVYQITTENVGAAFDQSVNAISVSKDKGVSGFWWACDQADKTLDNFDTIHDILHEFTKETVNSGVANASEFLQNIATRETLNEIWNFLLFN